MDKKLRTAIDETATALDKHLRRLIPVPEDGEAQVMEAMRYSILSGGKRLRPFLCVVTANMFGVSKEAALQTAAAIEMVHTYSLIHDDLPAIDDDDLRRGQPACHIMYDEATAILAGDALLTLAFEVLSDNGAHASPNARLELISALSKAIGCKGMVGGQMMDILAEEMDEMSVPEIIRLQRLKTGRLFGFACEAGAILGRASESQRHALNRYANDVGQAFQMTDDLLDVEGNADELGKKARKDKTKGKATLVGTLGIERAREQAQILADQAQRHLRQFDGRADMLRFVADYAVNRKN
jgi:farnesyl diphosphate synthase